MNDLLRRHGPFDTANPWLDENNAPPDPSSDFADPWRSMVETAAVNEKMSYAGGSPARRDGARSAPLASAPTSAPAANAIAAVSAMAAAPIDGPFVPVGPSPGAGTENNVQSGDAPPNGTVDGAVEAIVTDPSDVNTMWIGGPNGGIWVTHDGGATWTPLTDKQASLSISSLSLDPTDPTHNTLIAGIGLTSSGTIGSLSNNQSFFIGDGGQRDGVLYSTNGGATWTSLGATVQGFSGQLPSVVAVAARGQILLAACFEPWAIYSGDNADADVGGLLRSTDGGATFAFVTVAPGQPGDPVSALVGDPDNNSRLYAAVTSRTDPTATGIYVSNDTGATWTEIFGAAQSDGLIAAGGDPTFARVATASGGEIAIALIDEVAQQLVGVFLSQNGGTTWTALPMPPSGGFGTDPTKSAIALDPTAPGVVYVSGTGDPASPYYAAPIYRITTSGATAISGANTTNDSAVHADTRVITFNAAGTLILGGDGGIYERTNPQSSDGAWRGLNGGGLSLFAPYSIAFDGNSDRVEVASQDTGVMVENSPGGAAFTALQGGDGVNAAINDTTYGTDSVIYASSQNLFLSREVIDAQGNVIDPLSPVTYGATIDGSGNGANADTIDPDFRSPFVLNNIDPSMIALGDATDLYVTQDTSFTNAPLTLTDLGTVGGFATALSYGAGDDTSALLAGVGGGANNLWLSTDGATVAPVAAYSGLAPTAVTFDLRTFQYFYAADGTDLYESQNGGNTVQTLTANLSAINVIRPTSLAFISNNGVNALLVGALDSLANAQSPLVVADSDPSGDLSDWRQFGTGLPNTTVSALDYDAKTDTLAVGLFGRGAWLLYDVTSNFADASVLQFGLANNNSAPNASLLTGARTLEKYGAGTLTISGHATYTGPTVINQGTVEIAATGTLGAGDIAFTGSTTPATLRLDAAPANGATFANAIDNFDQGDSIDLANLAFHNGATATVAGTTLTLTDGSTVESFALSSAPRAGTAFLTAADSAGTGTVVSAACYCPGTMIATPHGERPIENFRIGEQVLTTRGQTRPIKWIGRRGYAGRFLRAQRFLWPVTIRAGALADGVPNRDLTVSPRHAMAVDGFLVPAECLVNGVTIQRITPTERVDYIHLELETHDVILVNGAASESFVDDDSRAMFANADEYAALYPDETPRPARYCAPRLTAGESLAALRHRLAVRAGLEHPRPPRPLRGFIDSARHGIVEGWAQNPDFPDVPVCLDILQDGVLVARTLANKPRSDLAAALGGSGRHAFVVRVAGLSGSIEVRRSLDGEPLEWTRRQNRAA